MRDYLHIQDDAEEIKQIKAAIFLATSKERRTFSHVCTATAALEARLKQRYSLAVVDHYTKYPEPLKMLIGQPLCASGDMNLDDASSLNEAQKNLRVAMSYLKNGLKNAMAEHTNGSLNLECNHDESLSKLQLTCAKHIIDTMVDEIRSDAYKAQASDRQR